jgi:hypothetical protein
MHDGAGYRDAMHFMVIERFKKGSASTVYARAREKGRMLPDGLTYVASWVEPSFERCFQVMETDDPRLLDVWADHWRDLVDFDFIEVMTSQAAAAAMFARTEAT